MKGFKNHPYIPNSDPRIQKEMLAELGLNSLEELHAEVPNEIKLKERMQLEAPFPAEYDLRRYMMGLLNKNKDCTENLCFLGAGCWPHYVPAICDEINGRGEFLTAYSGEPYNDFGKWQALFEYQSLMGELVDLDVVNIPTMDWAQAAATSARMAARINGRSEVLVPANMAPDRLLVMVNYCKPDIMVRTVNFDAVTGLLDLADLQEKISEQAAAVYFENPAYLGFMETQGEQIAQITHAVGAELIVGVNPVSLGIFASPVSYGADIVCGDIQPLGMHMNYGGGQGGFIATPDDPKYVAEFPSRLCGITGTTQEGEYAFGDVAFERLSYSSNREKAKEFIGTQAALWGITAGVYLSLMGPTGMKDIGETILQRNAYAKEKIASIQGVQIKYDTFSFDEFVVDLNGCGKSVAEINAILREKHIFGGKDLSREFPEFGQCALYCVTEIHTKADIDYLVQCLQDAVKGGR